MFERYAELAKAVVIVAMVLLSVQGAIASAPIANIYAAPSEAYALYNGYTPDCQDFNLTCSDNEYGTVSDEYSDLGDGSTAAASGATFKDTSNTQATFGKLVFDINGIITGNYSLRWSRTGFIDYSYRICVYANETHINATSCVDGTDNDGSTWHEQDISDLVKSSAVTFDNRIFLRFYMVNGYSQTITETYLKRPFSTGDFSVVATGVSESDIDERIENAWLVVSDFQADIENFGCEIYVIGNGTGEPDHTLINQTPLNVTYVVGARSFAVYWTADSSATVEGKNYEVECSLDLNDVHYDDVVQYVYINRQASFWEKIQLMIGYLLQLIGIGEDTQQLVSADAQMVDTKTWIGQTGVAGTFLTYADNTVDINATCFIDAWYPNGTKWVSGQSMTADGQDGRYTYNLVPTEEGLYQMRSFCNGTGLMNRTRYAYANMEVMNNVYMEMIT